MSDIKTIWLIDAQTGAWQTSGADLMQGDDLQTAVLISLFTNRRALPDDPLPPGSANRQGWWADAFADVPIGSRLWLLYRSKRTQHVLDLAQQYAQESLQWLIDDGVCGSFDVRFEWSAPNQDTTTLAGSVVAHRNDGTSVPIQFEWVWDGL